MRLLRDPTIEKAGVSTVQDEFFLQQQFDVACQAVVDVAVLALKLGFGTNAGTRRLAAGILSVFIEKDKTITVSRWNSWPLSAKQVSYAAADAVIARRLAQEMYSRLGIASAKDLEVLSTPDLGPKAGGAAAKSKGNGKGGARKNGQETPKK